MLLILGITPYAAVEKIPTLHGWQTRFMLLTGLPMAIIFVASARLLFGDVTVYGHRLRYMFLLALIFVFGTALVENYVGWQARWIKDRSLIAALQATQDADDITIYWVDDTFNLGGEPVYYQHEWDSIFAYAWQDDTPQTGFPVNLLPLIHRIRQMDAQQSGGCQAVLSIRRGPQPINFRNDLGLTFRYFVFKYSPFGSVDRYLQDVTDVRIRRILAPQASDCERQNDYLAQSEGEQLFLADTRWEVQKFRTDFIAFLERSVRDTVPERASPFSYFEQGGYPNPQIGALDYFIQQGFASVADDPPEVCVSRHNRDLLAELGFDVDYFAVYCMIGSQPSIDALIPES